MHVVADNESFPNVFSCCMMPAALDDARVWTYEISERRNDASQLVYDLTNGSITRMYGFNNMSYDYPLLHYLIGLEQAYPGQWSATQLAGALFDKTQQLVSVEWGKGWQNHIWPRDQYVQQCDLMMFNHFDNHAKLTSLKDLEFNLECPNVAEMPFLIGQHLTADEIPVLLDYGANDVAATKRFVHACMDAIKFREGLIETFGPEVLNWNDVKIGERYFIQRLEAARPGITRKDAQGRKPQTWRSHIDLGEVIFPYIRFERPELRELRDRLAATRIEGHETKGAYKFVVPLEGVDIHIGAGGIHGSLDRKVIGSTTERCIIDIDVTGYYPSIAIVNNLYPEHIGPAFVEVYRSIRDERAAAKAAGDTVKAGTLKLSNNGAFGKTNDKHSVLLDPKVMMGITVNGQLLQCLLAEAVLRVPGLRLLQLNTDGLTVDLPRHQRALFDQVCTWWQSFTCLDLEFTDYETMWLRDCNNYLARDVKGKMKRKGDYDHEMLSGSIGGQKAWNRDFSALVVPKAAEAAFVEDQDPADFIAHHPRAYDFLLRERVKGGSKLVGGHTGAAYGKLVRYYIATDGEPLVKIMPPLAGKTEPRRIGVHAEGRAVALGSRKDYRCSMCDARFMVKAMFDEHNRHQHAWPVRLKMEWDGDLSGIDHRWYVQQTEGLLF
jgi:hypothetical protein